MQSSQIYHYFDYYYYYFREYNNSNIIKNAEEGAEKPNRYSRIKGIEYYTTM